jgi:hypothetical protein
MEMVATSVLPCTSPVRDIWDRCTWLGVQNVRIRIPVDTFPKTSTQSLSSNTFLRYDFFARSFLITSCLSLVVFLAQAQSLNDRQKENRAPEVSCAHLPTDARRSMSCYDFTP